MELRLQRMEAMKREIQSMEDAIQRLTPEDRLILDYLVLHPRAEAAELLCQFLQVERSTVYRRKERALARLKKIMGG